MSDELASFLHGIAAELQALQRSKDYLHWRGEASGRISEILARTEPFASHASAWVFSGDGAGALVRGRFADWVLDRLVQEVEPEEIITAFADEVTRNAAVYQDAAPTLGLSLDEPCELAAGVHLVPGTRDIFGRFDHLWGFPWISLPEGTGLLVQSYRVAPAFEVREVDDSAPPGASETVPPAVAREAVRRRCRLACLLAVAGPVELPVSAIVADPAAALAVGGSLTAQPFTARALVPASGDPALIRDLYTQLSTFQDDGTLARAIDRLGRSRLAHHPADRALDLGMAAEIVLMHDHGSSNTEITFKLGSRAAWLLGRDTEERSAIFEQLKLLYKARSDAVHAGTLSARSKVDLAHADALVARILRAVLARGGFPDWTRLTLGG